MVIEVKKYYLLIKNFLYIYIYIYQFYKPLWDNISFLSYSLENNGS